MQNFTTLGQPLLGEKYVAVKEKKRKKNNPKNSGHFVRTPLEPKCFNSIDCLCDALVQLTCKVFTTIIKQNTPGVWILGVFQRLCKQPWGQNPQPHTPF